VPRPQLPIGCGFLRRLRHSTPGLHYQSRALERWIAPVCGYRDGDEVHARLRIVRQSIQSVDAAGLKRTAPECRYIVVDSEDHVVLTGVAHPQENLTFQVELDGKLPAGRYTVMAEIVVSGNAMNPNIERIPVVIGGGR